MSIRASGILSHALIDFEQIVKLPARLEVCTDLATRVADEYGQTRGAQQSAWRLGEWGIPDMATPEEQWAAREGPSIYGPAHTWIVFGERCLFVTTTAEWRIAIARPRLLEAVWKLLVSIGNVIGSETAVLWHDYGGLTWDWVQSGQSLSGIVLHIEKAGIERAHQLIDLLDSGKTNPPPQRYFAQQLKDEMPPSRGYG